MSLSLEVRDDYSLEEVTATLAGLEKDIPDMPVFLSVFWIKPWLEQCHKRPLWLLCKEENRVVSSIFLSTTGRHLPGQPFPTSWFNKTGDQRLDQIWIEYNDLLVLPGYRQAAITCLLNWCQKQPSQKWVLEITDKPEEWQHPAFVTKNQNIPAFRVKLNNEFANYDNFLAQCSSNSRSRIRRAIKYMQQHYGEITVTNHGSQPQPEILQDMMNLHRQRWGATAEGSGFDNPYFVSFHQALMANPQQGLRCELLSFQAGDLCLGYTYNLLSPHTVYFYLSGIRYAEDNNRFQPGLIMHTLAIAQYAKQGFKNYDFMGGDSQYKRSLSNQKYALHALYLYKKGWRYNLYEFAQRLSRIIRRKSD